MPVPSEPGISPERMELDQGGGKAFWDLALVLYRVKGDERMYLDNHQLSIVERCCVQFYHNLIVAQGRDLGLGLKFQAVDAGWFWQRPL